MSDDAPIIHIPTKHRQVIDPTIPRLNRFWREKDSGIMFEAKKFYRSTGHKVGLFVIIVEADKGFPEQSIDYPKPFLEKFEDLGNIRAK